MIVCIVQEGKTIGGTGETSRTNPVGEAAGEDGWAGGPVLCIEWPNYAIIRTAVVGVVLFGPEVSTTDGVSLLRATRYLWLRCTTVPVNMSYFLIHLKSPQIKFFFGPEWWYFCWALNEQPPTVTRLCGQGHVENLDDLDRDLSDV